MKPGALHTTLCRMLVMLRRSPDADMETVHDQDHLCRQSWQLHSNPATVNLNTEHWCQAHLLTELQARASDLATPTRATT